MQKNVLHFTKDKNEISLSAFFGEGKLGFKKDSLIFSFLFFLFTLSTAHLNAQVVINEILPGGTVELKNIGSTTVDVSGYWLCNFPSYQLVGNSNLQCGNTSMASGDILTVDNFSGLSSVDGELGLYSSASFGSPDAILDYVEWGSTGHQRSTVAVAAGIWMTGDFVADFNSGESLAYSGTGDSPASWTASATPTICENNCVVDGGSIGGGPFEFCVGDGVADNVSGITLTGNAGTNSQWVVTDEIGNILGLPPMPGAVDFDGAGAGTCLIWHLSFEDGLVGAELGLNANDLEGCYDLSNPITVIRNGVNGGEIETAGGMTELTICAGDGISDAFDVNLTGTEGTNSAWVITDANGNILALPSAPPFDLEGAGGGTCLVWHLSFEDGLTGAEVGLNAGDLEGCFDLSNPITVVRNQPEGGSLEGGPFEFCVGDGVADNVSGITLTGNAGANSQWVVTDEQGNILGLPPMPGAVDFDGAGAGTCLIWHLSFEDGLVGAELGMNANDLEGCYSLSNSITVIRVTEGPLCVTATNDLGSVSALNVYPNPAGDFVQVKYEGLETGNAKLQLVDIAGSLLQEVALRQNEDNIQLDISTISSGYYMISINDGKGATAKKLVVLR